MGVGREVRFSVQRIWSTAAWLAPILAVVAFVVLHVVAALAYPGGTRADPDRVGYSFAGNYWCDLMDATTYGGRANPGQPVALAAMVILCAGLGVLFAATPALFGPKALLRRWVVRVAGVGCALVAPWVGSSSHNLAVRLAGLLGVVAFGSTMFAILKMRVASAILLGLVVMNYLVWETGFGLPLLPLAQKVAFAGVLAWIVALSLQIREQLLHAAVR
jgi:hypothetical protein